MPWRVPCSTSQPPAQPPTCSVRITANGNLVMLDGLNKTLWSSQSACLATTPAGGSLGFCVEDSGVLTVKHSSAATIWSSQTSACANKAVRQLLSHSVDSSVSCMINNVELYSPSCASKLTLVRSPGSLQLLTANGTVTAWTAASSPGGKAPYGLCVQTTGQLKYMGAGGGQTLWTSSATASPTSGPFVAMIGATVVEVSRGVRCHSA
jgi:hypothetical protein